MHTISQKVEEYISKQPFLLEALSDGIINYSALARSIKPNIEKSLYKNIKTGSLVMALKRLRLKINKKVVKIRKLNNIKDITIRSNLVEYNFHQSKTIRKNYNKLLEEVIKRDKDEFMASTWGIHEVSIFGSKSMEALIQKIFKKEKILSKYSGISSLTIRLPEWSVKTPAIHYQILKIFAWHNINILETISTYTEFTLLLDQKDIDTAFSLLKSHLT